MEQKHRETFEKVAEWLEAGAPHEDHHMGFSMEYVYNDLEYDSQLDDIIDEYEGHGVTPDWLTSDCGSVACIGGAFLQFSGIREPHTHSLEGTVGDMLGYHYDTEEFDQMRRLFYPGGGVEANHPGWYARPEEAAKVLRKWLETGVADWGMLYDN